MTLAAIHVVFFIGVYSSVLEITRKHGAGYARTLGRGNVGPPHTADHVAENRLAVSAKRRIEKELVVSSMKTPQLVLSQIFL